MTYPASVGSAGAWAAARPGLSWLCRTGLLLPIVLGSAGIAAAVQLSGSMAVAEYTVLRPLDALGNVFSRSYVPAMLLGAFVLGRLSAPKPWFGLREETRLLSPLGAITTAVLLVGADLWWFPQHSFLDHLAVALAGSWFWSTLGRMRRDDSLAALLEAGVAAAALLCVSYAFTVVKAQLFAGGASPRDHLLFGWERGLWGEPIHRRVAAWASVHPNVVQFCDAVYYRLFEHLTAVSAYLLGLGRGMERKRYFSALCLCYILGGLAYFAVPSWGPAFFDRAAFSYLDRLPLITNFFRQTLLSNTVSAQHGTLRVLPTYEFLAAMPSLHLAHECVMLYYSRFSRVALILSSAFTLVTAGAVLVLGWHYVVDLVGGLLVAAIAVWMAERGREFWFPSWLQGAGAARRPSAGPVPDGSAR